MAEIGKIKRFLQNQFHIQADWGVFIGKFDNNILHRHYALQISVASEKPFVITDNQGKQKAFRSCFIHSQVFHRFQSDQPCLILLINPISSIGHLLFRKYRQVRIADLENDLKEVSSLFQSFAEEKTPLPDLTAQLNMILTDFKCGCEQENHVEDYRIYKAIQYLELHVDEGVSLKEIAAYCFLSETRFLHLFKEKTAINFRRYQIWNKLIKSLPFLTIQSITETAHQFGFSDNSHYSRSFKETFGLTPKILSQLK